MYPEGPELCPDVTVLERRNPAPLCLQAISETVGAHYVGVSGFLPAGVCFLYPTYTSMMHNS